MTNSLSIAYNNCNFSYPKSKVISEENTMAQCFIVCSNRSVTRMYLYNERDFITVFSLPFSGMSQVSG